LVYVKGLGYPFCILLNLISFFADKKNLYQVYKFALDLWQASALIKEICRNLDIAAKSIDSIDYSVVLRGDSTLRGHFPEARIMYFSSISIFQ